MPTPAGVPAYGSKLYLGDLGSPTIFSLIPNVLDINFGGFKVENVDVTSHSTGTPWRQKLPTLVDGGDITVDIALVPGEPTHGATSGLIYIATNRQVRPFKLEFQSSPVQTITFNAFVSQIPITAPIADVLKTSITITVPGEIVFA